MSLEAVHLQPPQFNRLFPYHLLISRQMKIVHCGTKLQEACPCIGDKLITEYFQIISPQYINFDFDTLLNHCGEAFIIANTDVHLNGHFEYLTQTDQLFFAGVPAAVDNTLLPKSDAEQKLAEQNKFYEDVLNGVPVDIAVFNVKGEYMYVNPHAIKDEVFRKWLIGKNDYDFCSYRNRALEIAKKRNDLLQTAMRSRQQMDWEEKIKTKEGVSRHFLRKLYPVIGDEGKVKFVIGYGIDITERKKYEDQLFLSEKRYRDLFNFSQALICTHDLNGRILTVNPAVSKLLEYTQEEMLGKSIGDFMPPHHRQFFKEKYLDVFETSDNAKGVFCLASKSGKENFLLYQNYKAEEFGNEPYIIGFSQDITERKKIEEAIRSGEEKYRSIMHNMNLGMVELDTESTIIFANENLCKMSGYEMDELIGQKLYNVFSAGQSRHFIKQKLYLKENGVSEVYEFVTKNKRGEPRWWLVSGSPLHTTTGEFKGSLAICLDITHQKTFEQELRLAKHQAEQSALAKDLFLANMSHEIRTPMNAILGMGKQMERTVMDGQQRFYLNAMNNAAGNLLVIINDILDFSKIEAGKLSLENVGFEMKSIVDNVLQLVSHKAESKGLQLSIAIDPAIEPVLIGDPHRINQVLINLLSNAIKFTEKGNIVISCKVVDEEPACQQISIEVKDTGIGMSDEFQKRLFEKFTQEDDKDGKKYGGTGLGMSIVKELTELMRGTITVESKKNSGTTVSITIPFIKGIKTDIPYRKEKKPGSNALFNKRILLVEDNEMNRIVATMILNQYGAIIDEAVNGAEAIDAMRNNKYDLVLMDMRMPVMDGLEATRIIRQTFPENIPIVALTANAVMGEQQKCRDAGMDDFLAKPFEEDDLINMIAKWIGIKSVLINFDSSKPLQHMQTPLFNIDNLKSISRGNTEFIGKMLTIFVKEISLAVQEIKNGETNNDIAKIRSTAHRIKPSLGNMSVIAIKNEIAQLELFDPADQAPEVLPELTSRVANVLDTVVLQVNELISSGDYV